MNPYSYTAACLRLHEGIVARYGAHPDVLDCLTIKPLPCPHKGGGGTGHAVVVHPTRQGATSRNVICAYWGDPIGEGRGW